MAQGGSSQSVSGGRSSRVRTNTPAVPVPCYLVAGGRDRTPDRAAAAGEGLGLGRRGAAAAGRGVVIPGVVLVHDPGKKKVSGDSGVQTRSEILPAKKARAENAWRNPGGGRHRRKVQRAHVNEPTLPAAGTSRSFCLKTDSRYCLRYTREAHRSAQVRQLTPRGTHTSDSRGLYTSPVEVLCRLSVVFPPQTHGALHGTFFFFSL